MIELQDLYKAQNYLLRRRDGKVMKPSDASQRNRYYRCLEYDHDQKGDICLISCGMERCDPGVNFGPELRDGYHLHAVLSGTGILRAGEKEFHPHEGQLFLLKDNEWVQYTASLNDPWRYCWVTYNGTEAKRITEKLGFTDGVYLLDSTVDVYRFFEFVIHMHEKPQMNFINDLRRRGILLEFLALAMEATANGRPERRYEYSPEVYIQRSANFINQNYAAIRVSDVVEYVGFTRSYFSTLFKKHIGISPQEYLTLCRLKRSCELLLYTDLSVQDIAARVGYEDQFNFSRIFKKHYGFSPANYRKNEKSEGG